MKIKNFRCFIDFECEFFETQNVIIGHNCTGKSNLLQALGIIFDSGSKKRLGIHDFNKHISLDGLKESPPKISISIELSKTSENADEETQLHDLGMIANWITKLEEPYEARLTYEYFLPADQHEKYEEAMKDAEEPEGAWKTIENDFLRYYTYKIWGGDVKEQASVGRDDLSRFDYQFLDAIRDVERDMYSGKSTLLKDVLDFFIDYDIKADEDKGKEQKRADIEAKKKDFAQNASELLQMIHDRLEAGKTEILSYASDIGALFEQSPPNFSGLITEQDLFDVLNLVVAQGENTSIPISHNGLGYNNLIYIALLLSKMQMNADGGYLGSNAKHFPILAIEEPEAHLHPTMQYQFLDFLTKNMKQNKVRQVFITTHSTHIVASVPLDNILCLYKDGNRISVAYPGAAFEKPESKNYVQRFLDATKSDMLFAERVVLVEGITEQILLPIFAKYLDKQYQFETNHVSIIGVGGITFDHFLNLFDTDRLKTNIKRTVACLTDVDPMRKVKDKKNARFRACYPFEYETDKEKYEYKQNSLIDAYKGHTNICIYHSELSHGRTFEYDLAWYNPSLTLLLTDSISNKEELKNLMEAYEANKSFSDLKSLLTESEENTRICAALDALVSVDDWSEEKKKRALIAARYHNSVKKGQNALELAYKLEENLDKKSSKEDEDYKELVVPPHIKNLVKRVCS